MHYIYEDNAILMLEESDLRAGKLGLTDESALLVKVTSSEKGQFLISNFSDGSSASCSRQGMLDLVERMQTHAEANRSLETGG